LSCCDKALLLLLLLQVDVWWGDACSKLPEVAAKYGRPIDFLLLDGMPKETLAYLQAAEPHLAPGAVIVADNAGEDSILTYGYTNVFNNCCTCVFCLVQFCIVCLWTGRHRKRWRTLGALFKAGRQCGVVHWVDPS
jgi:hypothetical protein